jgi:Cytochrome P460
MVQSFEHPNTSIRPEELLTMKTKSMLISASVAASLAVLATGIAISAQDKYTLKVPGGLAFSEFKGYETWQTISVSHNGPLLALILGNPTMIDAYKAGIPGNGKPFPEGSKMAKIHWVAKKNDAQPSSPLQPGALHDVDFMVKDSKRFADSAGWGYAVFEYDAAAQEFKPGTTADTPPQANDAKCGAACHTLAQKQDYVFTEYARR